MKQSSRSHDLFVQVVDFLQSVVEKEGKLTGVTSLIGSMVIKPAHNTSDEEV